jgi:hypothetical protein
MTTQSDAEPLPVVEVKQTLEKTHSDSDQVPIRKTLRLKPPFLDADPDDVVPGYSDSNDWYEP